MSKYYVYSTLASNVSYQDYAQSASDLPNPSQSVLIKGGAGVANNNLITPRGVVTEIDESQMAILEENKIFQLHRNNGFIRVEEKMAVVDTVVADMVGRDNSAPLVPEDFIEGEGATPKVTVKKSKK